MLINGIDHSVTDITIDDDRIMIKGTTNLPGLVPFHDATIMDDGILYYADIVWVDYVFDGVWNFEIDLEVNRG